MAKNKKVMSIAINPEVEGELRRYAKRKGVSASAWIGDLVQKALKLDVDDEPVIIGKPSNEEVMPIVLKVPSNLKGNPESLRNWMDMQVNGIVAKLGYPGSN